MPTSVRLDIRTERTLVRLARKKGTSKSAVPREAVDVPARQFLESGKSPSLHAKEQDLLGRVAVGDAPLPTRPAPGYPRGLQKKASR